MKSRANRFAANLVILLSIFVLSSRTFAHSDAEPLWAMDNDELAQLEKTISEHRIALLNAMNDAINYGVPVLGGQRNYRFDSDREVVDIPRSVLNRVIMSSLELETATMKRYLGCEAGCEHSLAQDLAGTPNSKEAVTVIRSLWPKMKASFAIVWKDIPVGIWMRTINSARYSRSLAASGRYQSKAYGGIAMVMGAASFGAAFAATEVLETMFMGPLHFVCKANYFWSVAFGAAVAGLSRDLKTLLLFEKDEKSFAKRFLQALSNFASLKNAQRLEKRILFKTLAADSIEQFHKISRRAAHSSVLEPLLDKISARQSIAADPLLWSELVASISETKAPKKFRLAGGAQEALFQAEVDKIVDIDITAAQARARWQDMNASMRVVLRIFRNGLEVSHQLHHDQADRLRALGLLDMQLRTLDLFNLSWLSKRANRVGRAEAEGLADWLRNVVSEWMALAIETTTADADLRAVELKRNNLNGIIAAAIRRGEPVMVSPEGPRDLRAAIEREATKVSPERPTAIAAQRSCDGLFRASLQ
ncbi:hypothetical protein BH10BDE1_BH10BDE1_15830 [soil metagenome]